MAKIIGIDLGTTYSAVSVWDDKKKEAVIIPNLSGSRTTPSVVSFNKAGQIIVGEEAKRNLWAAPDDTVAQIKREMGTDFHAKMRGKEYNPQTISAFILRYLKQCAEAYLGEPVHDAVVTCPAYFKEVQRSAARDAGMIAGLNIHQLINEPTSAAIAYGLSKHEAGQRKIYAVYDLGGGTFDVSIIEIADEITVLGTGGDSRLGGLDMDEAVTKWALRRIRQQEGVDLNSLPDSDAIRRRLKVEAEQVKKSLVVSDTATLSVPYLTMIDGKPFSVELAITRAQFEMQILPLLQRSIVCLEEAIASAKEINQIDWEDLDGVMLVGGPTRLHKIRELLRETLKKHAPDKEPEIKADLNPDEVVAMGAAIVGSSFTPFGRPPAEMATPDEKTEAQKEHAAEAAAAPVVTFYDVTGHSLGIAIEGGKFHRIIKRDTPIPVSMAEAGFSNAADYTTQLLVEVYQGEDEFIRANTKIGEVKIDGIEPLPKGQHVFQVEFILDLSGTLSTICTDLRTRKTYEGSFVFKDFARVSKDEIDKAGEKIKEMMPDKVAPAGQPAGATSPGAQAQAPAPAPAAVPQLTPEQVPAAWRVYWVTSQECLPKLDPSKKAILLKAMARFAQAVQGGNEAQIEDSAYMLQDALLEVQV